MFSIFNKIKLRYFFMISLFIYLTISLVGSYRLFVLAHNYINQGAVNIDNVAYVLSMCLVGLFVTSLIVATLEFFSNNKFEKGSFKKAIKHGVYFFLLICSAPGSTYFLEVYKVSQWLYISLVGIWVLLCWMVFTAQSLSVEQASVLDNKIKSIFSK